MNQDTERKGLLSRLFPRPVPPSSVAPPNVQGLAPWADNNERPVHSLVTKVVRASDCLIVTGYQDFLSSLAYLIDTVGGIGDRPAGSIRMVFGTNTDSTRQIGTRGRPVAEEARAFFLGAQVFPLATWPTFARCWRSKP